MNQVYECLCMTRLLGSSKVSPRYQITIPEDVRKAVKIDVGNTIGFVQDDNGKIYLLTEL